MSVFYFEIESCALAQIGIVALNFVAQTQTGSTPTQVQNGWLVGTATWRATVASSSRSLGWREKCQLLSGSLTVFTRNWTFTRNRNSVIGLRAIGIWSVGDCLVDAQRCVRPPSQSHRHCNIPHLRTSNKQNKNLQHSLTLLLANAQHAQELESESFGICNACPTQLLSNGNATANPNANTNSNHSNAKWIQTQFYMQMQNANAKRILQNTLCKMERMNHWKQVQCVDVWVGWTG